MKHIKKFESFAIKHTDEISMNHILRDFSRKLEDIIILLREKDNFEHSSVKRYFYNDGCIKIIYNSSGKDKLMTIKISNDDEFIFIKTSLYKQWFDRYKITECNDFYKFVCNELKKYKYELTDANHPRELRSQGFKIPLIEKEDIIDKIYEYKIKLEAEKYNL